MEKFNGNINKMAILPHNIEFCYTSERDYEMNRIIILVEVEGLNYGDRLVLDGGHCSCYDFDETAWDAIVYTREEFAKLAKARAADAYDRREQNFWDIVCKNAKLAN